MGQHKFSGRKLMMDMVCDVHVRIYLVAKTLLTKEFEFEFVLHEFSFF